MVKSVFRGTALITGGATRLGGFITKILAQFGYDIALHYHSGDKEAQRLANYIHSIERKCVLFQADLTDTESCLGLIQEVASQCDHLNVLVNNAALQYKAQLRDTNVELFDHMVNLNLKAPFFLSQQFTNIAGKGHIINLLDSDIGKRGTQRSLYILSKKWLYELTTMAALEFAPNVAVNGICPGMLLPDASLSIQFLERYHKEQPIQEREDLLDLKDLLALCLSRYSLTGQCFYLDGGRFLRQG